MDSTNNAGMSKKDFDKFRSEADKNMEFKKNTEVLIITFGNLPMVRLS
jgi:hypothetical protein